MIFSDLYKSGKLPLTKLRSPPSHPLPADGPEFDADLVSRDKTKQKEAVKKYLAATIRNDWAFTWPPNAQSPGVSHVDADADADADTRHPGDIPAKTPGIDTAESREHPSSGDDEDLEVDEIESADDTASVYSTVSDDPAHFRARAEWTSDLSDDGDYEPVSPSAYRFDSPDTVASVIKSSGLEKRAKRRKAVREEESWNGGLACFNARRDAWTSAKTARVKPKPPVTPMSPATRRLSFWRLSSSTPPVSPTTNAAPHISPLSPTSTHHSGDSTAVASSSDADSNKIVATRCDSSSYPVETLLPIPPPLLPPANPMRASITPATYPSIYDRIVVHSMTPACPVNLGDVLRACVAGWKRDGEWPPRSAEVPTSVVAVKKKKRESNASHASTGRRMSLGFLGRRESATGAQTNTTSGTQQDANGNQEDGAGAGKAIRRSIQKVFGLGHERRSSNVGANGVAAS
ncbi:hypothetical protein PGQ11_008881 [Apiospora arundinis]|uniref:Gag1-like clamp domain-containing protein n=1 Tax=Apiospora arundinis TaxID=335852 RepID=A0ABR2IGD6_9PEZI